MSATLDYSNSASRSVNRLIFPLALATTAATLFLIFLGGLVTSHGAGMSVPDWPNSYGYNMFTFPVSKWVGGIFYEHTHRLMASAVGCCSLLMCLHAWGFGVTQRRKLAQFAAACGVLSGVALACLCLRDISRTLLNYLDISPTSLNISHTLFAFKITFQLSVFLAIVGLYGLFCRHPDTRRWVRGLTLAVLIGVIFQGLLGGFRVVLIQLGLAIIHACVAQAFLCLVALLALISSRQWTQRALNSFHVSPRLVRLIAIATIAIYAQLIVGALMRHNQAGLAIPDLPLAYGHVLPPTDQAQLDQANALRLGGDPRYSFPGVTTVTLTQVWLHFAHRCGAILVTCVLGGTLIWILTQVAEPALRRPAWLLVGLLITQVTLGWLTVQWRKPADIASTHVAVGAATLMTTFILYVRARKVRDQGVVVTQSSNAFPMQPLAVPA